LIFASVFLCLAIAETPALVEKPGKKLTAKKPSTKAPTN
jgi:hypothetical protein